MRALIFFVSVIILMSCNPDVEKMTVIKDCTGVYLRSTSGSDYKVCNEEDLSGFANGEVIKVEYDNLEECFGLLDDPSCTIEHSFSSKVEVTDIK